MSNEVSIKTIAEKTGFAASTISRVMNGRAREYRISEETEQKIKKIADKYDYKPNPVAVNLRVKKSNTIGLVIPSLDNPFFVNITGILNKELSKRGYNIILTESYEDPAHEKKIIKQLVNRNIDGLLIIPCEDKDENASLLDNIFQNMPVLCIDRYIKDSKVPYIITNNEEGAYLGVKHLIEKGHKEIACIKGLKSSTPTIDREKGYVRALEEFDLEPFYIGGDAFSLECGYREANKILSESFLPSAIFAMSSTIALGAMKAIKEYNFTIPEDISLIGFDDNIFLDHLSTPLTTIAQPIEEISKIAANALIEHIDDKKKLSEESSKKLTTNIIYRDSVLNIE